MIAHDQLAQMTRRLLWASGEWGLTVAELRSHLVRLGYLPAGGKRPLTPVLVEARGEQTGKWRRLNRKRSKQPVWAIPTAIPQAQRDRLRSYYGVLPP